MSNPYKYVKTFYIFFSVISLSLVISLVRCDNESEDFWKKSCYVNTLIAVGFLLGFNFIMLLFSVIISNRNRQREEDFLIKEEGSV
jgi:hypothetical protein